MKKIIAFIGAGYSKHTDQPPQHQPNGYQIQIFFTLTWLLHSCSRSICISPYLKCGLWNCNKKQEKNILFLLFFHLSSSVCCINLYMKFGQTALKHLRCFPSMAIPVAEIALSWTSIHPSSITLAYPSCLQVNDRGTPVIHLKTAGMDVMDRSLVHHSWREQTCKNGLVMDWRPVRGSTYLSSTDSWDRLQQNHKHS